MTDRDRLINLARPFANSCACKEESGSCEFTDCKSCNATCLADVIIEDGWIRPPCKVGDIVYSFCDVFGEILPYVIQDFKVGFLGKDRPNHWYWEATSHATETDELLDEIDFDLDEIGKTVFLTKEEAEEKLKELG